MNDFFDIIIIGAGAVGCAAAREISRYQVSALVLEKESDAAFGTSGRNSAVVHAGFNNKPGSLMAKLCVEGSEGFEQVCRDLDVPYKKTGKILAAFDEEDMETLKNMKKQGEENGCKGLRLINRSQLEELAGSIGGIGGMYSPNTAIFDPFTYCIALAENALENGVQFSFDNEVLGISCEPGGFKIRTQKGYYTCKCIVNAAGLYCDKISAMAGADQYKIYPCRGEYFILDKIAEDLSAIPLYPAPKKGIGGLGVHLTPTIDGNIIIGPSAEYIDSRTDYSVTAQIMDKLFTEARELLPKLQKKDIIGNFAGIRPKQAPPTEGGFRDFIIKEEEKIPGFINLIGIESPGMTASVPIARMVTGLLKNTLDMPYKHEFKSHRTGITRFRNLTVEQQNECIASDPEYGEIICRCQKVTKREIREAIENPFGARSLSSIKYRAWPMTGRCSGGYCMSKIADMLINEYHIKPEEIRYRSEGSQMYAGEVK